MVRPPGIIEAELMSWYSVAYEQVECKVTIPGLESRVATEPSFGFSFTEQRLDTVYHVLFYWNARAMHS